MTQKEDVEEDQIRQCLNKLDIRNSVGFDSMQPQVLRELADVIVRLLTIMFERLGWWGKVPENWKTINVIPLLEKGKQEKNEELLAYQPHFCLRAQKILEAISKHVKEKKNTLRTGRWLEVSMHLQRPNHAWSTW